MSSEAELLRDQRIAEAWKRWPNGRLFENSFASYCPLPGAVAHFRVLNTGWAFTEDNGWRDWGHVIDELSDDWTEIPRPTPTLPDPSGDLPDGTRVRVTLEGTVREWTAQGGELLVGEWLAVHHRYLNRHQAVVEALPTPPPSALDGKPGSLWRDPETGTTWVRIVDSESGFTFAQVGGEVTRRGLLAQILEEDAAMIARLVPAQVADDE